MKRLSPQLKLSPKNSLHQIHSRRPRILKATVAGLVLSLLCLNWSNSVGQVKSVVVGPNDTLASIARKSKVTVAQLRASNAEFLRSRGLTNIKPDEKLSPYLDGEFVTLQIQAPPAPATWITHSTSLEGDTLASIADFYGVRLSELRAANTNVKINGQQVSALDEDYPLPPSQLIEVPPGGKIDESKRPPLYQAIKAAKPGGFVVTQVAPGAQLSNVTADLNSSGISIDSQTLAQQNGLSNTGRGLRTGQVITASLNGGRQKLVAKVAVTTRSTQPRVFPRAEAPGVETLPANTRVYVTIESPQFCGVLYEVGNQFFNGWIVSDALRMTGGQADVTATIRAMNRRAPDVMNGSSPLSTQSEGGDTTVVTKARRFLGVPYVWGGASPRGTDCSGLVLQSFRLTGQKRLPRVSRDQFRVGTPVDVKDLRPGDRLYFSASRVKIDHTGLFAGKRNIIEANGGFGRVIERDLFKSSMFKRMYVGARRGGEG